ncbi:MAG: helix-turn-helix domain-containing protein [Lachnospiraceae bacterium]|nr:helix-turn-helix domain-containing protein [Lachnospiraceae bacterium]
MDVTDKLKQLTKERGWTEYRLTKESKLPASTIANIFHHGTIPSIATLEILCNTFGLTLSQFFSENEMVSLSKDQENLLKKWSLLNTEQQKAFLKIFDTLK